MIELISLTLENEMDLVLAQKKAVQLSESLDLRLSTQAIFATAVAELARVVIDFTDTGTLTLGVINVLGRYSLSGIIKYETIGGSAISEDSYHYVKKLVPVFNISSQGKISVIEIIISLPKSLNLYSKRVEFLKDFFSNEPPISTYEEVKRKNQALLQIAQNKDQQLRQSQYIDDKRNEFISIASHELKTPITIIKAYTQMALSGKAECSEQVKDFLMKIDAQSTKLKNLVQQLLDTSKIENGKLEYNYDEVEFNSYINESSFLMTHLLPNHKFRVILDDKVRINLDRARMDQVFTNLISNAGKYSPAGSLVTLQTSVDKKGLLTVSVADEGIGMSDSSIEKIFQKFHRDKQVIKGYSGLGMGLYIASEIISDHGGKIWVESIKDKGSTFHFTLPILAG
ncbi:MAG: sensor histidine kinase [Pyrinomonadaceae bacterium]|nr:sensor histidine kinase [Sphingobacteriaceae bacterium]